MYEYTPAWKSKTFNQDEYSLEYDLDAVSNGAAGVVYCAEVNGFIVPVRVERDFGKLDSNYNGNAI